MSDKFHFFWSSLDKQQQNSILVYLCLMRYHFHSMSTKYYRLLWPSKTSMFPLSLFYKIFPDFTASFCVCFLCNLHPCSTTLPSKAKWSSHLMLALSFPNQAFSLTKDITSENLAFSSIYYALTTESWTFT